MKKLTYFLLGLLLLSLVVTFPNINLVVKQANTLKYQQLLAAYDHEALNNLAKPTGPDKATYRDFLMTVDIAKGYVPVDQLKIARKELNSARVRSDRDFQWHNLPIDIPGRARAVLADPNDGGLWSGTVTGGLWKKSDVATNQSWDLIQDMEAVSVSCMAFDPQQTSTMYLGTGESQTAFVNYRESTGLGTGIWKSTDAGVTWNQLSASTNFAFVNDLVIREESGNSVIYAATASGEYWGEFFDTTPGDGLYRSTDGGTSWEQVLPNIAEQSVSYAVSDIELASDGTLYVGTMRNLAGDGGGKVLKSNDGINWEVHSPYADALLALEDEFPFGWKGGRVIIKTAASNSDRVYALFMAGLSNGFNQLRDLSLSLRLFQSTNAGDDWSEIFLPAGWSNIPWHAAAMAVDPNNDKKLVIGALDIHVLHDADNPYISELDWLKLTSWFAHPSFYGPNDFTREQLDSLINHYVHADIHDIQFVNGSSDQLIVTTDGGAFFSGNMSDSDLFDFETNPESYPHFKSLDLGHRTGQYYTVALDPTKGSSKILAGAQDNGSVYAGIESSGVNDIISGGDGAYVAWDSDDDLRITSSQANYLYMHHDGIIDNVTDFRSGTFINPFDYDDVNNLMYCNQSTGRQGGLFTSLNGRYLDTLLMLNTSPYVGKGQNGFPNSAYLKLGTGTTEPFSAVKLSPNDPQVIYVGTHFGKIYKTEDLHGTPGSFRIDDGQLPVGYVSSIDVGTTDDVILVTISNYGLESVWYTSDGGEQWQSIERNLPDMPVRWGLINPYDNNKVLVATELGVWGMENIPDPDEQWQEYNTGLPRIRVDMMDYRAEDSVLALATHGRGIWLGKLNQGEILLDTPGEVDVNLEVFPNPTSTYIRLTDHCDEYSPVEIYNLHGIFVERTIPAEKNISVENLPTGVYIVKGTLKNKKTFRSKVIVKH